jgi:hypothetical protein
MRRALAAATAVCALLGAGAAQAGPASKPAVIVSATAYQSAEGSWLVHDHGDTYMYFAGASRELGALHNSTAAWADRSKCVVAKGKNIKVTLCVGSSRLHRIPDGAFQFDPTLQSAHVKFTQQGVHNSIDFVGHVPPQPDAFPDAGTYGAFAFADLYADASAGGRVLNHHFSKRDHSGFSYLDEGAMGIVFIHKSKHSTIRYRPSGNRIHYRAVFRTPVS